MIAAASQIPPPRDLPQGLSDFSVLYAEQAERILLYLARRCLDPEIAVDLMAETFAEAYASRRRFRGRTSQEAEAWLFAIARHCLSSYLRRGRAERKALERLGVDVPELEHEDYVRIHELAGIDRQRAVVAERFDGLPAASRDAMRMRIVEESGYPEIAARLGISEETARARVSRGLRKLANELESNAHREEDRHA